MKGTRRFTVTLPTELLEAVDRNLIKGAEDRSAVIRRLLEAALREAEEQRDTERYIQGYREHTQTEEELGWCDRATLDYLTTHP